MCDLKSNGIQNLVYQSGSSKPVILSHLVPFAEAFTCANPAYTMMISSAEAFTCVLYYVTPTAAALKQVCHVSFADYYCLCFTM